MTRIFLLLLTIFFAFSQIEAKTEIKQELPPSFMDDSPNMVGNVEGLKGFSKILFFLYSPSKNAAMDEKIANLAVENLKQLGTVERVKFSHQNFFGKYGQDFSSNPPALIYQIKAIECVQGKPLPFLRASLLFQPKATIEKNSVYCPLTLWAQTCYIKTETTKDLDKAVSKTLSLLLKEFKDAYFQANPDQKTPPTFYFMEN